MTGWSQPYPWQGQPWQRLQQLNREDRMPHALLFSGVRGLGKHHFAEALAASLLCAEPNDEGDPCGYCSQCQLLQANNHPDKIQVIPESEGHSIKVEQIRAISQQLEQTIHSAGARVVIIHPAQAMTTGAANALLKTLEETNLRTILILVCEQEHLLPATIVSRCQRYYFPNQGDEAVKLTFLRAQGMQDMPEYYLRLAQGAPLAALEWLDEERKQARSIVIEQLQQLILGKTNPIECAQIFQKNDIFDVIEWLNSCLIDILRNKFGLAKEMLVNADTITAIAPKVAGLDPRRLYTVFDKLLNYKAMLLKNVNLNKQLQFESCCFELAKAFEE